jgi:hypothetical protein
MGERWSGDPLVTFINAIGYAVRLRRVGASYQLEAVRREAPDRRHAVPLLTARACHVRIGVRQLAAACGAVAYEHDTGHPEHRVKALESPRDVT